MMALAEVLMDAPYRAAFELDLLEMRLDFNSPARLLASLCLRPGKDSRLYKEVSKRHNNDEYAWDDQTMMLMIIANAVRDQTFLAAYKMWMSQDKKDRKEKDKPKQPDPILPPGYVEEKPPMVSKATELQDKMANMFSI
jgi:hypothetical protein